MLSRFFWFLYNFFFIDQKNGNISHTKFFSVVGYTIMCFAFVWVVVIDTATTDSLLWMVYGAVVIGNRSLNKRLEQG